MMAQKNKANAKSDPKAKGLNQTSGKQAKKHGSFKLKKSVLPSMPDEIADLADKLLVIGHNVRRERKLRDFSIEQLAEYLELSPSYVGLLERGQRCPSLKIVFRLCELFGLMPNQLLLSAGGVSEKKDVLISEERRCSYSNKLKTVTSIINMMSEPEIDLVVNFSKGLRHYTNAFEKE